MCRGHTPAAGSVWSPPAAGAARNAAGGRLAGGLTALARGRVGSAPGAEGGPRQGHPAAPSRVPPRALTAPSHEPAAGPVQRLVPSLRGMRRTGSFTGWGRGPRRGGRGPPTVRSGVVSGDPGAGPQLPDGEQVVEPGDLQR